MLGISPRYLSEMMANDGVHVDRVGNVGSVGATKINFIPVDEIPRIREKLHQQREAVAIEDARETPLPAWAAPCLVFGVLFEH